MKKSLRSLIVIIVVLVIATAIFTTAKIKSIKPEKLDVIAVNDIVHNINNNWQSINETKVYDFDKHGMEFVLLDNNNKVILKTDKRLTEDLTDAFANYNAIIDIYDNDQTYKKVGKLIIQNKYFDNLYAYKNQVYTTCLIVVFIFALLSIGLVIYIYTTVYRPFNRLQSFAKNIASGNLDIPLKLYQNCLRQNRLAKKIFIILILLKARLIRLTL